MAEGLSGGAKCIKYTLFVFNLLFLLGGLALIIVGAVVQVQSNQSYGGSAVSAGGIFIIIVGSVVFLVSFFGCAGAINNNYCMVVTYGVLLLLLLLAEIAAVITGFYMKNQIQQTITDGMTLDIDKYQPNNGTTTDITTKWWDETQQNLKCCGSSNYTSWLGNGALNKTYSVPDSCCQKNSTGCGQGVINMPPAFINATIYTTGCVQATTNFLQKYLIAVGAVAAAVALLELLGIIFAFCLAHSLRKDYRVV
jgi:CD63 antigen